MPTFVSAETYGHMSLWGRHKFSITLRVSPRCNQRAQQSGIAKHGSPEGLRACPQMLLRRFLAAPCGSSKYGKACGGSKRKLCNQMSTMTVDCSKIYIHIPYIYAYACFPNAYPHTLCKARAFA